MAQMKSERKRKYQSGDVFYGLTVGTYRQALIKQLTTKAGHQDGAPSAEIINRYSVGPLDKVASEAPADQPSFLEHIAQHPKYKALLIEANKPNLAETNQKAIWKRKSKAGLSWITSQSAATVNREERRIIHFCLDGYDDYKSVVAKDFVDSDGNAQDKPAGKAPRELSWLEKQRVITSSELRWIYRNREDPGVMEAIQFWRGGEPVAPPWFGTPAAEGAAPTVGQDPMGNEQLWSTYKPSRTLHRQADSESVATDLSAHQIATGTNTAPASNVAAASTAVVE